jgi:bla regulator protein blaR1
MIPGNLPAIETAMANHLWQSTLFAVLAAILTLPLRNNQARVRYCLWLAASIKFLLPFSLLTNLGSHLARLNHVPETRPVFYFVIEKVSQPFNHTPGSRGLLDSLLPNLPPAVALLWLVGFITAMGLCCSRWRRVAAAKRSAAPISQGREVDALRRLEQAAGMRKPIAFWSSPGSLEPGILGIFRPVLLWPAGISERLQDAHLEAILAHELQHVRRRDNLAAATHMVVEAIFWFHPLVWWLGARLVEEREQACDEAVLQQGNVPQVYAESILKTCQFSVASPLACVSGVTGGDLKKRIVRIMSPHSAATLSLPKKLLLAAIGIGSVVGPVVAGLVKAPLASAQSSQFNLGSQPAAFSAAQQPDASLRNPYRNFATPSQIYHVGGGVSAPKLLFAPDPEFSEKARKAKYQGVCVLALIVDEEGKPQRIQVVRHLGMGLDKKAVEAVKQYKFEPAMRNDKPVAVEVHIEVNFRFN